MFGATLPRAEDLAALLADTGVQHGHLGPREVPRLWERHLLNSALLCDLVPAEARVVDVGSGAGLPGLVMAIRRPDLDMVLLEPMLKRVEFLRTAVLELSLSNVTVLRGRAEDRAVHDTLGGVPWVVARAVAPLGRLVGWSLPLLVPGGRLLAMKGASATAEVAEHTPAIRRSGGVDVSVRELTAAGLPSTWVVVIRRGK